MMEFKRGLMNWGSEDIIKKYLDYQDKISKVQQDGDEFFMLEIGDTFFKNLRKEMGFNDSGEVNIISVILTPEAREQLKAITKK